MIRTSLQFNGRAGKAEPHTGSQSRARERVPAPGRRSAARACNYDAPAGLFVRESSRLRYQRFARVALAVQHANENLTERQLQSCTMEVDNRRFLGDDLRQLYLAADYPLPRRAGGSR